MASIWEDFIDNLKDDTGTLAKAELKAFVNEAKEDSEAFLKRQGAQMERYLTQLANNEITSDELKGYLLDMRDLVDLKKDQLEVQAEARAQRIVKGISDMLIDGLLGLI